MRNIPNKKVHTSNGHWTLPEQQLHLHHAVSAQISIAFFVGHVFVLISRNILKTVVINEYLDKDMIKIKKQWHFEVAKGTLHNMCCIINNDRQHSWVPKIFVTKEQHKKRKIYSQIYDSHKLWNVTYCQEKRTQEYSYQT